MRWDVIVVGGGPAGSATAAMFASAGRSVLVLDAATFPRPKPCAEYISPGGAAILRRLGVLDRLAATKTGRWLAGMEIIAPGGIRHLLSYTAVTGERWRGLSVPRTQLDATLLTIAADRGAVVRQGYRVQGIKMSATRVAGVIGPRGEHLHADLVVGADGLNSRVARAVSRRRRRTWPRRLGLVAHFKGIDWPEPYGRMFVGPRSYVGVAPLDDAGWLTVGLVRELPQGRLGPPAAALSQALQDFPELTARLETGALDGPVSGVGPLARRVSTVQGPGFALVGDAAGFFDPFSGEGIYRALRGAELLTSNTITYERSRRAVFGTKARLVALIQVMVQNPRLMNFAVRRLQCRPAVARQLGAVLGDLEPAHLNLAWHLLGI